MTTENFDYQVALVEKYLNFFCLEIPSRTVGRSGNRRATDFFRQQLNQFGWETEEMPFDAMDWTSEGATLVGGNETFEVQPSPYAPGCDVTAELAEVHSLETLLQKDVRGKILLLHGALAAEPVMPKNFMFYNPEEHQKIVAALENSGVLALVTATARHSALAGGVYPFPLIEDGDFDIPSVFMTEEEGLRLANGSGRTFRLHSTAQRIPASGCNILGKKGTAPKRIVVTAHIDAKPGTPGAIDNAAGVVVLLLLAELLQDFCPTEYTLEILALNGEDYYAVPGQMLFLRENEGKFSDISLNINIDCAGYRDGPTAISCFDLPAPLQTAVDTILAQNPHFVAGIPWYQGDHTLFLQQGVPALVFASEWFLRNLETQTVTHTPDDVPALVEPRRLVEMAYAIGRFLKYDLQGQS